MMIQESKKLLGQESTTPARTTLVWLNLAGMTNTLGRAELAATAATITNDHIHIATNSLNSLHQIN